MTTSLIIQKLEPSFKSSREEKGNHANPGLSRAEIEVFRAKITAFGEQIKSLKNSEEKSKLNDFLNKLSNDTNVLEYKFQTNGKSRWNGGEAFSPQDEVMKKLQKDYGELQHLDSNEEKKKIEDSLSKLTTAISVASQKQKDESLQGRISKFIRRGFPFFRHHQIFTGSGPAMAREIPIL